MNPIAGGPGRPALRPLACGVLLALTSLAAAPLLARDLVDEHETIAHDHAAEAWRLTEGSTLTVNGASTHFISVNDTSAVTLNGATVTRQGGSMSHYAMNVLDEGRATATNTAFVDGGIWVSRSGRLELFNSSITVDADAPGSGEPGGYSWGLSINNHTGLNGRPEVVLDASRITVADFAGASHYSSGIGAFLAAGSLALVNGSAIRADNVGVVMRGFRTNADHIMLSLDDSHIETRRGSAIEVAISDDVDTSFHIQIARGSTLKAGDNNLLLVRAYEDAPTAGFTDVNFTVIDSVLEGDIHFDDRFMQGSVDVSLRDRARITGRFINVTTADIQSGSGWTLTGDSNAGALTLGATGAINLGGNGATFNTLTLGHFTGEGGTLVFNTQLEGDDAQTDRLHITGDANGSASVRVIGVGGNGALTDQGIELIDIDGASNAVFTLQGRAVGGIHEYNRLLKGADGSWYLHSQEIDDENPGPDPEPDLCAIDPSTPDCVTLPVEPGIEPDPEEPGKPAPVLRPEIGAYLANQAAMGQLLSHSAHDRMAGVAASDGVRTWASTSHTEGRMEVTGKQRLDTRQSRLQVGADMGVFDGGNGRVGAMLSAGQADATSRSTVTGYRADAAVEGGAVGVYAHWRADQRSAPTRHAITTLDASVQVGRFSNRVAGEGLEVERYEASAVQASVEAAHRFEVGRIGRMALSLQPEVQLTYTAVRMDTHLESTGTVVERDGGKGLSTRVGVRLEGEAAMAAGQFRPYVALHGIHDGRDNGMTFDGVTVEGALPRSRVELSAGGQVQFGSKLSGFGGISASQGEDGYRDLGARVGLSYRW